MGHHMKIIKIYIFDKLVYSDTINSDEDINKYAYEIIRKFLHTNPHIKVPIYFGETLIEHLEVDLSDVEDKFIEFIIKNFVDIVIKDVPKYKKPKLNQEDIIKVKRSNKSVNWYVPFPWKKFE